MTTTQRLGSSLLAVGVFLAAQGVAAQEPLLGPAVDGRVEPAASNEGSSPPAEVSGEDAEGGSQTRRPPRSQRTQDRIRGGAGLGGLAAFDDTGSGRLFQVQGRFGAQLNALFGIYAQLGIAGGDMEQRGGVDGRALFATFAVIPEFHLLDELAIGLGPVGMAGARDVDQIGPRYREEEDPFVTFRDDREEELVDRYGLMLRVSPAIGEVRPSGRIHAFRPSFEIAVLGTHRDLNPPEQNMMVLAGVSLGWDTW